MIQDIAPHTYHNEYKPSAPDKNSFILAYEKGSILLPHQEREADIYFPRFQDLEEKVSDLYSKYIYLFSIDDQRFYLIPELDTTLLPDYEFQDIRNLRTARPQYLAFAGVTGQGTPDCRRKGIPSYVLFGCAALVFHSSRRTGACCTTGKADVL